MSHDPRKIFAKIKIEIAQKRIFRFSVILVFPSKLGVFKKSLFEVIFLCALSNKEISQNNAIKL